MGAEVLNSTFGILMNFCTKFEHSYFEFPHFGKPKTVLRNKKKTQHSQASNVKRIKNKMQEYISNFKDFICGFPFYSDVALEIALPYFKSKTLKKGEHFVEHCYQKGHFKNYLGNFNNSRNCPIIFDQKRPN
jgi:hypothetical protein